MFFLLGRIQHTHIHAYYTHTYRNANTHIIYACSHIHIYACTHTHTMEKEKMWKESLLGIWKEYHRALDHTKEAPRAQASLC